MGWSSFQNSYASAEYKLWLNVFHSELLDAQRTGLGLTIIVSTFAGFLVISSGSCRIVGFCILWTVILPNRMQPDSTFGCVSMRRIFPLRATRMPSCLRGVRVFRCISILEKAYR